MIDKKMIKIEKKKLDNGLSVVFIQNNCLNALDATMFVKSGSIYEREENRGISHLIEHLVFYKRNSKELRKHFPFNLELNAWTRKDFSCFDIYHHKSYHEEILKVLYLFIKDLNPTVESIEEQVQIILQEINENREDPFSILGEEMDRRLYPNSSLSFEILGKEDSLKKLTPSAIKRYHDDRYSPENMLLAISGNFKTDEIEKTIEATFAKMRTSKRIHKKVPEVNYPVGGGFFDLKNHDFEQVYIGAAFPAACMIGEEMYFKTLLLADILEKKIQILREGHSDFYDIDLHFHHLLHTGEIRVITSTSKEREGGGATEKLIEQLININISELFFKRIKEITRKQFLLRRDDIQSLSSVPLYEMAKEDTSYSPEQEAEIIDSIEYADIKNLKSRILKRENCYVFKMRT
ncbi:MAG: M16 family metallopeptidase [Patescibacteria group bacterium]